MTTSRTKRRQTRRIRRQKGANSVNSATNFLFENPLHRAPRLANTRRLRVNESAPLFATLGRTNINTRRRSLNDIAYDPRAQRNVVRNYKSPAIYKKVADISQVPQTVRYTSEYVAPTPQKMAPSTWWLMQQTKQMPGSRHLQI